VRRRGAGGLIAQVRPGSIGDMLGLRPGDRLLAINGHRLRDIIDYQFYGAEEELTLVARRGDQEAILEVERDYEDDLGLEFEDVVFDGMRQCVNRCPFCFVRQMPPGMRPSLYVRDDDYRYSFLMGNFITLTNLTAEDWARIGEQRLSPLYVSVHATNLEVRRRMLGNPRAPDIRAQIARLGRLGIEIHAQVVIVPGMNDGAILEETIADLLALWPTVRSLALVPVGLTRFRPGDLRTLTADEARRVLDLADALAEDVAARTATTWLYPSDELYLLAGEPIPPAAFYREPAQFENGVGLMRQLLDDWVDARGALSASRVAGRATLACGQLVAPTLRAMAHEAAACTGAELDVVAVENRFFGPTVTVSGLLTGGDLLDALRGRPLGEAVFVPRAMFDAAGERTLDDLSPDELAQRLGVPLVPVTRMSQVLAALER